MDGAQKALIELSHQSTNQQNQVSLYVTQQHIGGAKEN